MVTRFFIGVPDDAPSGRRGPLKPLNFSIAMAAVCERLPTWTGPDGLPRSWGHFVVGLRYVAHEQARESLTFGAAARMAQAERDSWAEWVDSHTDAMGDQ